LLEHDPLRGISFFGAARYRDSWPQSNPNEFVEASSMFNPSNWQSGTQFRVLGFGLHLDSLKMLPVEHMLTFKLGWVQPQKEFLDQPLSKLFYNNAVNSAKGVGGNIPFSSSFSTWGGVLTIRPHDELYLRNAIFMAFPQATASTNHGLAYAGFAPNPSQNGLFYMGELGYTPRFTAQSLPGKYAFGGYFYGLPGNQATSWNGTPTSGQYGFYFQADQMLYRETHHQAEPPPHGKGKSATPPSDLSKQGLNAFNLLTFAPGYAKNNVYPFYFQTGLVYTGLVPTRDADLSLISLGYGAYQRGVEGSNRTYTAVIEAAYRYQINGWSYAQPFVQYFIRPDGTQEVSNATVLGLGIGVIF
jgi:carbohydrate-selective porin OprB